MEYIKFLYNLRSQYLKNDPMNFIAKILLNSLYGRFGMDDNFDNINVIHKDYYSDFDSIYTDSDIEDFLIDNKILGKLKLENVCTKAIFLAPKLYCLLTESGDFIHKVKGLARDVSLELKDFQKLLIKNVFIEKMQTK